MTVFLLLLCVIATTISLFTVVYGAIHNKKEAVFAGTVIALSTIAFLIVLAQSGWLS